MTWFKVDDSFYRSRKVRRLGKDRVPCVGLWTLCGDWSADNLTDGFVPWEVVEDWDLDRSWAARLIEVALWFETEHDGELGIRFHDWDDWQPTKEQVIQRRKADAERRARWRDARRNGGTPVGFTEPSPSESRQESRDASRRDTDDVSRLESRPGSVLPDPTRPVPSLKKEERALAPLGEPAVCFDDFYAAYPRKKDRRKAEQAWKAAIKRGADPEAIVRVARTLCEQYRGRDTTYVKYPATWLNADAYRDEPEQQGLRLVVGGHEPYRNPTDQSAYDEPMFPTQETP